MIKRAAKAERARRKFWDFCLFYDHNFFSRRSFLQQVAEGFQSIYDGEHQNAHVSMPPRAGKSYVTSLFCAWFLGKNPEDSVMRNTCTARLYYKFSYDVRNIIRSVKYAEVFPEIKLSEDQQNIDGWSLTVSRQVAYFGAGVGGTIIGFGASGLALTDDLYRGMADALSSAYNDKVHQWKEAAHDSRVEQNSRGRECPQIDIGTRWSRRDIIGKNFEEGFYDLSIVIKALNENKKSFCEFVHTTEYYLKKEKKLPQEIWTAEYQQEPIELKGLLFPRSELKRFRKSELRKSEAPACLGYIDVADEGNDYFCFVWGHIFPGKVFVSDIVYTQRDTDHTTPRVVDRIENENIDHIRVESNNQGSVVIKDYRKKVEPTKILKVTNSQHKHTRIFLASPFIREYFYFLHDDDIEDGSEYDQYLDNLGAYMKDGSYKVDDGPDATSGLAKFIQANPATSVLFDPVKVEEKTESGNSA